MLACIGFHHRTVPLDLLSTLSQHTDALATALADPHLSRASVVLTTCNRVEVFLDVDSPIQIQRAISRIADHSGLTAPQVRQHARILNNSEVVSHLIAVASGLESVMIGETEIRGQVRRAWARARDAGTLSPELEQLFQSAAQASREIQQRTGVQSAGRSLVQLALDLAAPKIGDWATTNILLAGTGRYARASLVALRERGAHKLTVYSPTGRAERFAATHGIRAVHGSALEHATADADLIVTTSLTLEPVFSTELFARSSRPTRPPFCASFRSRITAEIMPTRPRLVIDLGMPRNVAPDVSKISGVHLIDLEVLAAHAPDNTRSAETHARELVGAAVREYEAVHAEAEAVPAILALREHVNWLLQDELRGLARRTRKHGSSCASSRECADTVERALRHFAARLSHQPSVRIRQLGRRGKADSAHAAVRALFGDHPTTRT